MDTKITKTVKSGTHAQTRPDKNRHKGVQTSTAFKTTTITKTTTIVTKSEPVITKTITLNTEKHNP